MAAMKRLEVSGIERNRAKFARMDALEREEVVRTSVIAALEVLDQHFPGGTTRGGLGDQAAGELHSFVEGLLERRFEN